MAKSFKKFRSEWDDEWGYDDEDHHKDDELKARRDKRRKKNHDRESRFDGRDEE